MSASTPLWLSSMGLFRGKWVTVFFRPGSSFPPPFLKVSPTSAHRQPLTSSFCLLFHSACNLYSPKSTSNCSTSCHYHDPPTLCPSPFLPHYPPLATLPHPHTTPAWKPQTGITRPIALLTTLVWSTPYRLHYKESQLNCFPCHSSNQPHDLSQRALATTPRPLCCRSLLPLHPVPVTLDIDKELTCHLIRPPLCLHQ